MTSHLLAHSEVAKEKRRQSSILTQSNRSSKSSLCTLLSRRKHQLKGERKELSDKDEAQLIEELTKMRKKKAQKLELRNLLEKGQKAENSVSFYIRDSKL